MQLLLQILQQISVTSESLLVESEEYEWKRDTYISQFQ